MFATSLSPDRMGKRRERRVTGGSDHRGHRVESERSIKPRGSKSGKGNKLYIVSLLVSVAIAIALSLVYFSRPDSSSDTSSVLDHHRRFVKTDLNYLEVLSGNLMVSGNESHRNFTNPVLAYVTPWNSRGYDIAKRFNSKFTHISPVWYDLKSRETELVLEGRHNADRGWILELRKAGNAKILPRVVLEAFPAQVLEKKKQRRKAIDLLVAECKEMEYDGIVLESWSRWSAFGVLHDPRMRKMALDFIKQLGQALHGVSLNEKEEQHLELVYVIGPPHGEKLQPYDFGPEDLKSLGETVDGFSLMTYDFSSPQNPGPNAPLKWVRSVLRVLLGTSSAESRTLLNKKIFVGINFYGNDFPISEGGGGGGAITGRDYISLLEKHRPSLQWEKKSGEHLFVYTDNHNIKHAVFYPSPLSILLRLDEARSWGAGISIWELGQGLDYFFDLL